MTEMRRGDLGPLGAWVSRSLEPADLIRIATTSERLGWKTMWIAGGISRGAFDTVRGVLDATERIHIGTSILNMWAESPAEATTAFYELEREHPGRFIMGVGPSHAPIVERGGLGDSESPIKKSRDYLAQLAAQPHPVPPDRIILSALGPLALRLAADSTSGSVPYLTVPAHTTFAREILGEEKILAPELAVVLETDRHVARDRAREFLARYLSLPNYTGTLLRFGFDPRDLLEGGSDRLIDTLFGMGDASELVSAITAHFTAGADHVAVQVLTTDGHDVVEVLEAIDEAARGESWY